MHQALRPKLVSKSDDSQIITGFAQCIIASFKLFCSRRHIKFIASDPNYSKGIIMRQNDARSDDK